MIPIWQAALWMALWFFGGVYIGYAVLGGGRK